MQGEFLMTDHYCRPIYEFYDKGFLMRTTMPVEIDEDELLGTLRTSEDGEDYTDRSRPSGWGTGLLRYLEPVRVSRCRQNFRRTKSLKKPN